jgi:hypothetical protein
LNGDDEREPRRGRLRAVVPSDAACLGEVGVDQDEAESGPLRRTSG